MTYIMAVSAEMKISVAPDYSSLSQALASSLLNANSSIHFLLAHLCLLVLSIHTFIDLVLDQLPVARFLPLCNATYFAKPYESRRLYDL